MTDFPVGSRVRFKTTSVNPRWVGTVTAHIREGQVECDGSGSVPISMIELVPADPADEWLALVELQATRLDEMVAARDEYQERAIDLLELYLLHHIGERRPVHMVEVDLRELVMHLRGGTL